ncbi:MAG: 3-dehydroquinate synthase, partial [Planctomycetes bacterium]|nr:3-dehydroquinate synthase [Planctomycetota bacterium]
MRIVHVQLPERAYTVTIGRGTRHQLADLVARLGEVERVTIIADQRVAELHLDRVIDTLEARPTVLRFPPGEASKSLRQAERLYAELAGARIARRDLIVTLGGGVAGDLGGFVAATWLRGIRFVQMPTTLLAAIDASIGGKTAVNHSAGKNLIGAFHQPAAVLVDIDLLETLPRREYVAGLAESVKHAVIRDATLLEWHEQHADDIAAREPSVQEELIARSCEIKAEVVVRDERESDLRMILNHGHTIGHALEHLLNYELRHGECVALGMIVENELARRRGLLARETAERIATLIERAGLPTRLPQALNPEEVAQACRLDKKVRGGVVNFMLLKGLGLPARIADVSDEEIAAALH